MEIKTKNEFDYKIDIRKQIFALNNLSTEDLRMKWLELYKSNPKVFKRNSLIKGLAYKIQLLAGEDEVSEEEVDIAYKIAKERLKASNHKTIATWNSNTGVNSKDKNSMKEIVILPPAGSIIKTTHKNKEYVVKIIDENKFSYNGLLYTSLSAIAKSITGTQWSGYAFFKLKKKMVANAC